MGAALHIAIPAIAALIASGIVVAESSPLRLAPPYVSAGTGWHATAAVGDGPGSVRTREYQLALGLYRRDDGGTRLDFGVDYEYTHLEFRGIASRNRDVHRLRFPLRFAIDSGQHRWRGYVAPRIATSSNVFKDFFNRGSRDDLQIDGRLELGGTKPWLLGVAYDQSFGRPRLYPVAGIDVHPDGDLRIRIAFPDSGAWLKASDRHAFSARLYPSGERWRVVSDDFRSDFDLRREEWRAQLTWSVTITPLLAVSLSAGQAFERRLVFTDRTGARVDEAVDSEMYAEIGFRWGGARGSQ